MTVTLAGLRPNTLKADIYHVLQRFAEIKRILVHPGGRSPDVYGVKRTLYAYAEGPLFVRGREIIVFWKYANRGGAGAGDEEESSGRGYCMVVVTLLLLTRRSLGRRFICQLSRYSCQRLGQFGM